MNGLYIDNGDPDKRPSRHQEIEVDREPRYSDEVEILEGFYEGKRGNVVSVHKRRFLDWGGGVQKEKYTVSIHSGLGPSIKLYRHEFKIIEVVHERQNEDESWVRANR